LLRPWWKWFKSTWSGKERSGTVFLRLVNLAHAAHRVSFSFYWNVRISIRRALTWDVGKKTRPKFFQSSSQSPFTSSTEWAYQDFAFHKSEKGNNFHLMVSCVMPAIARQEHKCSNSLRWAYGFLFFSPEKGEAYSHL
jgi:hypothetical protein